MLSMNNSIISRYTDTFNFLDDDRENYDHELSISMLKILCKNDLLSRKKIKTKILYAWYAIMLSDANKLDTPIWAFHAIKALSNEIIKRNGKFIIDLHGIETVKKDIVIVRAVAEYASRANPGESETYELDCFPTKGEIRETIKSHKKQKTQRRKRDLKNKSAVVNEIAQKYNISPELLKKNYYSMSPVIKKGSKKSPGERMAIVFPCPFSA